MKHKESEGKEMPTAPLTPEEKLELVKDPHNTKVISALISLAYKPQLDFWGREGLVAKALAESFPNDSSVNPDDIEFGINPKFVKLDHHSSATQSVAGIVQASLKRESILPGTFGVFVGYAVKFLDLIASQFKDLDSLLRFGIRVQQLNQIKNSNLDTGKRNLYSHISSVNSLNSIIQKPYLDISSESLSVSQTFNSTLTRGNRILKYKTNFSVNFGEEDVINRYLNLTFTKFRSDFSSIMTDIDLYLVDCSIEEAKRLCLHAGEFVPDIHSNIIREMKI